MKPILFILEDDALRRDFFKKEWTHCDITFAIDIDEALNKFTPTYDLILLDHDLGGEIYVPSDNYNTGYQFVKHLCSNYRICPSKHGIVVHSMNEVGSTNMCMCLEETYGASIVTRIPFNFLMQYWYSHSLNVCGKIKETFDED
jgi:CheY-like chemotaxis protein